MRVRAYCRPIVDVTVAMSAAEATGFLNQPGLETGVLFVTDATIDRVRSAIAATPAHREQVSPGGPVSNAIFALARSLGPYPRGLELEWCGPYPGGGANTRIDPLPSLREVGIRTLTLPTDRDALPISLCLVDREFGETLAILVGDRTRFAEYVDEDAPDIALLMLSDLPDLLPGLAPATRIGLLTADIAALNDDVIRALDTARERIDFVFSSMPELRRLGLLDDAGTLHERLIGAEVIATDSAAPVHIWAAGASGDSTFDVGGESNAERSFLGAGDAYAGTYLGARLLGTSITDAHSIATAEARIASYSLRARQVEPTNLTDVFGTFIERSSPEPDWQLYGRVRQTAGVTVVTSYNSGVDTIGGAVATELGLPWFAVMPQGRRRDPGEEVAWSNVHLLELGTPSYRYCTWTNAFLADGTLLVDIARGEGSEETRRACRTLGRPLLELGPHDDPNAVFAQARAWATRHAIKTVQIAGSREAKVSKEALSLTHDVLRSALLGVAGQFETGLPLSIPATPPSDTVRIGIPRLPEVSRRVSRALRDAGLLADAPPEQLSWTVGNEQIVLAKSRDLVRAVAAGTIELAIVGEDMVIEEDDPSVEVIARAGVHNTLVAAIGPISVRAECGLIAAQYPGIARSFAERWGATVVPVTGAGEGWIAIGAADFLVDTWRTGKTADINHLKLEEELVRTSLTLIGKRGSPRSSQIAPWVFNALCIPPSRSGTPESA